MVPDRQFLVLRGRMAVLAGKPDLIIERDDKVMIIDVKTGRELPWHAVQLRIYKYALVKARPEYRDRLIAGRVVYPEHITRLPRRPRDRGLVEKLGALIRKIAAPDPPLAVPSAQECRYCDITELDCPERLEGSEEAVEIPTEDF